MIATLQIQTSDGALLRRRPTTQHPVVAFIARWEHEHRMRDGTGCPCPLGALCQAFSVTASSMEDLLFELELAGRIRRVADALGAWDVRCT
jgi:hypothetical protein